MNEPDFAKDRSDAAQWAADVLSRRDWVILDTETTGLDGSAEIVQIAILDHTGATLLDTLVKPTTPISAGASRVHGITDATVANAPSWAEVREQVHAAIAGKIVLIYNAAYDTRLIQQSDRACGITLKASFDHACVMEMYAQWAGDWNDYYGSYRWQKLPSGDHSARGDCLATLKVLREMAGSQV